MPTPRRMSFFDVGGLLDDPHSAAYPHHPPTELVSPIKIPHLNNEPPSPASLIQRRRGSHVLLEDIGGLLSAPATQGTQPQQQPEKALQPAPTTRNFSRPHSRNEISPLPPIDATTSPDSSLSPQESRSRHSPGIFLQDASGTSV